jgi:hypothetical protein
MVAHRVDLITFFRNLFNRVDGDSDTDAVESRPLALLYK